MTEWADLSAARRDVLIAVAQLEERDQYATTGRVKELVAECGRDYTSAATSEVLRLLVDDGMLEKRPYSGRGSQYVTTTAGRRVIKQGLTFAKSAMPAYLVPEGVEGGVS